MTPAKNGHNLKEFELHLIDKINSEDTPPTVKLIKIQRELHRPLLSVFKTALNEVKLKNGIDIVFPDKEDGSEEVEIVSSENDIQKGENALIVF